MCVVDLVVPASMRVACTGPHSAVCVCVCVCVRACVRACVRVCERVLVHHVTFGTCFLPLIQAYTHVCIILVTALCIQLRICLLVE